MTVQQFLETFIKENTNKKHELGVTTLVIYKNSTRNKPIAACEYNKNLELRVVKPSYVFRTELDKSIATEILNSNIQRLGLATGWELSVVIGDSLTADKTKLQLFLDKHTSKTKTKQQ
jgi:hypothetical protein